MYFSKEWAALTEASVRNFLAEALSMLPLPGLLRSFEGQQQLQQRISELEAEVKSAAVASFLCVFPPPLGGHQLCDNMCESILTF